MNWLGPVDVLSRRFIAVGAGILRRRRFHVDLKHLLFAVLVADTRHHRPQAMASNGKFKGRGVYSPERTLTLLQRVRDAATRGPGE